MLRRRISERRSAWSLLPIFALLLAPLSMAQLQSADQMFDQDDLAINDPAGDRPFCENNKCPGSTCDEVNDRCVGDVTLQPAMGEPLLGLSAAELERFEAGKVSFARVFTAAEGLGPAFNKDSCGGCHASPLGGSGNITVNRFGLVECTDFGDLNTCTFDPLDDLGGSLQQSSSIAIGCEEFIPLPGDLLPPDAPFPNVAMRLTNSTLGFGLVEAIPDSSIEFNETNPPNTLGNNAVSGRVHYVGIAEEGGALGVGRFGWKLQVPTVLTFSGDASIGEMGITNRLFGDELAQNGDAVKLAACDMVADPEDIPDAGGVEFIDRVTDFQRFTAAPPQTPRSGMTGEVIFNAIGCADCHISEFVTDNDAGLEPAIAAKVIRPYSDFLLHDVGFNGDFIEQGDAGLTELRTTLLWGLRVRDPLWHDGRFAAGTFETRITAAIGGHNDFNFSEGIASAQAYDALSQADKDAVLAFLDSLGKREFDGDGNGFLDEADQAHFDACFTGPGSFFTADDACAVHDTDQDGDIDDDDRDLLNVALGIVVPDDPNDDDETDDEGSEDEGNDGGDDEDDENFDSDAASYVVGGDASGGNSQAQYVKETQDSYDTSTGETDESSAEASNDQSSDGTSKRGIVSRRGSLGRSRR